MPFLRLYMHVAELLHAFFYKPYMLGTVPAFEFSPSIFKINPMHLLNPIISK